MKNLEMREAPGSLPRRIEFPEALNTIPHTHGLHRFPGKFIPQVPGLLIATYGLPGQQIVDPFCGSGTTLIEAALRGHPFVGVDIDRLAVFLARTKTCPVAGSSTRRLLAYWNDFDYDRDYPEMYPNVPNLTHWFSSRTLQKLSAIKKGILELKGQEREISLAVFSSIIRRSSNADDQTQKTYVSHTLHKKIPDAKKIFLINIARAIKMYEEYLLSLGENKVIGKILAADSREKLEISSGALVVTSPPYIDSIDYIYNQMLEYFWLMPELGIERYEQIREMRRNPMGFNRSKDNSLDSLRPHLGKLYAEFSAIVGRIRAVSEREAQNVVGYFCDYVNHVQMIGARMDRGGRYCLVVGQSIIRKERIPTDEYLTQIFSANGFHMLSRAEYVIRRHYMKFPRNSNSGKILTDHILVFEK